MNPTHNLGYGLQFKVFSVPQCCFLLRFSIGQTYRCFAGKAIEASKSSRKMQRMSKRDHFVKNTIPSFLQAPRSRSSSRPPSALSRALAVCSSRAATGSSTARTSSSSFKKRTRPDPVRTPPASNPSPRRPEAPCPGARSETPGV
jgi:hypothetical protein